MAYESYEHFQIDWQGMLIEVRYCADYCPSYRKVYGHGMSHMTLETVDPVRAPLPITDTGFLSQYTPEPYVAKAGGIVQAVLDALEVASTDPSWIRQREAARQYALF